VNENVPAFAAVPASKKPAIVKHTTGRLLKLFMFFSNLLSYNMELPQLR
jgi:hypothetical protein